VERPVSWAFLLNRRSDPSARFGTQGSTPKQPPGCNPTPTNQLKMKNAHLVLTICLLAIVTAIAQDRTGLFFDNFDTATGVQVYHPESLPVITKKTKGSSRNKKLVQKTVQSRMNVSEGLAAREMPPAEYNKLLMSNGTQLKGFSTGNVLIDSYIVDSSRRYAIDPLLIYSQMHQESSFKLRATSYKGASGLMQLMPATARRLGVTDIYDPRQNIEGGVKYMRMLLDMFGGDVNLALAGYNAGEGAVMKYGYQIPPYSETREYVRRISTRYGEISDPRIAHIARRVGTAQASKLGQKESRPLSMYEPAPVAVKLADGTMRLVNQ